MIGKTVLKPILHLIATMDGGGAERQLVLLARSLPATGWEPHVALFRGGPNLSRLRDTGSVVHDISLSSPHDPRILTRVLNIVRRVQPAIIQTWLPMMDVVGGTVSMITGLPWILSERSSRSHLPHVKGLARDLLARRATAIVANSMTSLSRCHERWPRVPRYFVPNAVPLSEIDAASAADVSVLRSGSARIVIAAGRLERSKNHVGFIESIALASVHENIRAVVFGIGPMHDSLAQLIADRGLSGRVILKGYVDDLWAWMKAADLFVSLSEFEGRPNTVLEAMASRTPMVISDIPEHREFLTPRSAVLIDPHDHAAAAAAIVNTLRDPTAAERRAAVAREEVTAWSPPATAVEYARLYALVSQRS